MVRFSSDSLKAYAVNNDGSIELSESQPTFMQRDFIKKMCEELEERLMRESSIWGFDVHERLSAIMSVNANMSIMTFSLFKMADKSNEEILLLYDAWAAAMRQGLQNSMRNHDLAKEKKQ